MQAERPLLDIYKILLASPHRYPFLMIDRVVERDTENSLVALKNITYNEPFFPGHFKGKPIMPGVLIIEALAQTSLFLFLIMQNPDGNFIKLVDKNFFLTRVEDARFIKQVIPGDTLMLKSKFLKQRALGGNFHIKFEALATVNDQTVATAKLSFLSDSR